MKNILFKRPFFENGIFRINYAVILFIFLATSLPSCKKFVDAGAPVTTLNSQNVFESDATAIATLTGIYTQWSLDSYGLNGGNGSLTALNLLPSLSADDLTLFDGNGNSDFVQIYINSIKSSNSINLSYWQYSYTIINKTNAIIDGLKSSAKVSTPVKNQLLGEAYFVRSFCYFNLINLYDDVPFVTSTNYANTSNLSKTSKSLIYTAIIEDLKLAQSLLNSNFLKGDVLSSYQSGNEERVRPNKYTATALLARAYLYTKDYTNAEIQASTVISNKSTYDTVSINNVFLKNSKESIWSLPSVNSGTLSNTAEGILFLPDASNQFGPGTNLVYLSSNLINSFQTNDKRLSNWTKSIFSAGKIYYFPTKYKIGLYNAASTTTEYSVIFRLAEQYLIRSECRAYLGNINGSLDDLNVIRKRAGLPSFTSLNQSVILAAILQEYRSEFFTEWGQRWFNLKRTNTVDQVMAIYSSQKVYGGLTGTWNTNWKLYPIPLSEIRLDPNLIQNPGYGSN
ncbi:Starch-binding associating with outer membrane [Mucilaginibacter pineti]|uniref:Starch-binding associating with outer membrane n=1 Tax=Mucilaginibacter pineti TaxID=1391627 RepID=A0A1G7ISI1_9SPHI|nr:RagB/SusD family nutrient uptake outer membrane protein [Mucilaginibacter pineti]SDF15269.1 Starch-binding associating with outer membrane [Mucilaginibacter pineti]